MAVEIAILIQIVRVQGISLAENLFYHPDIVPYIGWVQFSDIDLGLVVHV